MRTFTFGAAVVAAALSLFLSAFALSASAQDNDRTVPDEQYDFVDGSDVGGSYRSPLGERIASQLRSHNNSLVRPRLHFVPELLKSVERL